jgi:YggT family protein
MISLYNIVDWFFWICSLAILLRVLFSWLRPDPQNVIVRMVVQVTEPFLAPLRRFVPTLGGLDITPMIALMLIEVLRMLIMSVLFR